MHRTLEQIEYGDFQTPLSLAEAVCRQLSSMDGIAPDVIIEPTCGTGAFVIASASHFPASRILGYDINNVYLTRICDNMTPFPDRITLKQADYFDTDWNAELLALTGRILVIGNFPWVTNSTQGSIGGINLPEKSNFLKHSGLDAITGKANFDISEWMLLDVITWLRGRDATVAMLCKTAVARKVLFHAQQRGTALTGASIMPIDAMANFSAAVDACLLTMHFSPFGVPTYDFAVYGDQIGTDALSSVGSVTIMGKRNGLAVSNLQAYESNRHMIGASPVRWRSGVKHDARRVMELERLDDGVVNGYGQAARIEDTYLYPMLKGGAVFHGNITETNRYMIVPQSRVGAPTQEIKHLAPKTWDYLVGYGEELDSRKSTIYKTNPRFSIFGVGDYSFMPWKVAISALHKELRFRLIGPIGGKPVMLDDTTYFMAFSNETEAREAYRMATSPNAMDCLRSLIFLDEKRPVKAASLNNVDWSRVSQLAV